MRTSVCYNETLRVGFMPLVGDASRLGHAMLEAGAEWHSLACQPWAKAYPYRPDVRFLIAHSGDHIMLHYRVEEEVVAAIADCDNGRVWEDSCCEFFLQPDAAVGQYYNVECNCAGRLLVGVGQGRECRVHAPLGVIAGVRRWSSLGRGAFPARKQCGRWQLSFIMPLSTLFRHNIVSLSGLRMRGNFYKCGDGLPRPHFLSWSGIRLPSPDFHCPQFFGSLLFD